MLSIFKQSLAIIKRPAFALSGKGVLFAFIFVAANLFLVKNVYAVNYKLPAASYGGQTGTATYGTGNSVTYTISYGIGTTTGSSNQDNIALVWTGGSAPTGVTYTFTTTFGSLGLSGGSNTAASFLPTSSGTKTITLTITTSGTTPISIAGYGFTLTTTDNNGGVSGSSSGLALVVLAGKRAVTDITTGSQTGTETYGTGASVTYTNTLTESGSTTPSSDAITVAWSGGTPTGVTTAFTALTQSMTSGTNYSPNGTNGSTIRLTVTTSATTPAGTYNFTVTNVDNNGGGTNTDFGTLVVGTKALTVSSPAVTSKAYDGTNPATITGTLNGIVNSDVVTLNGTGTFATVDVGTGISVTSTSTLGGANAGNYTLTQPTGLTGSIITKALTLTSPAVTPKIYDGTNTATVTGTLSGVVSGDVVTLNGTGTFATVDVATGIVVTSTSTLGGADAGNYTLTQPTGLTGTITTKALTVTSPAVTAKLYDGTNTATVTGTLSGVVSGDVVTLNGTGTFASVNVGSGILVTSTSTLGGADAGNYTLTQPTGLTGNISAAALTITASTVNKAYGIALTGGTSTTGFTTTGLQHGETITGVTITYGTGAAATDFVGTYFGAILATLPTGTFVAGNYSISYVQGDIIVGTTPLTITATTNNKTYGNALSSGPSGTGFTTSGLKNGEVVSSVYLGYGTGATATAAVGTYTSAITPSIPGGSGFSPGNYSITYVPGNIVVGQANLTITASVNNKTYGTTLTSGTSVTGFTTSALQNSETVNGVTLTYGTGAPGTAAVGTYTNSITPSLPTGGGTFLASNYNITYTPGNIVIGAASLNITASVNNKTYGTTLTSGAVTTGFTTTGLQNGETVTGVTLTYGTGAVTTAAVGTYSNAITPTLATGSYVAANYTITYTPGNIVVSQASLIINATTNNKTYGTTLTSGASTTGFSNSALQNGETLSGVTLTYGTGGAGTATVGIYTNAITPSLATGGGGFSASNYNITYIQGTIIISTANLTITASTNNKTYGTALTSGNSTTGFTTSATQNGETVSGLTLTYGTGATATVAVGTYSNAITPSLATGGGTFLASNYNITYTPGNIVIGQANLTVTASVNNKTYGTTLSSGTSVTGFTTSALQNGETVSGVTLTYGTGAAGTANIGTYTNSITPSLATGGGTFLASNYNITYTPGNIVVGKATLTVTASVNSKTYGTTLTSGTSASGFTTSGLQNGETVTGVTLTYGTGAAASVAVGTYSNSITPSLATGSYVAANYNINYTPGNIVIGQANLTVTASVNNKTYGAALTSGTSAIGFTTTALQNGETVSGVTLTYGSGAAATAAVGTYSNAITPSLATGGGTFLASNYNITYTPGNIVIGQANLTVTASVNNKTYGTTLTSGTSAIGFTTSALQNGETVSGVTLTYGAGAAGTANIGTYTNSITLSLATGGGTFLASNYNITYSPGNIVIGAAVLNITASTNNKTYGTLLTSGTSATGFTTTGLQNGETITGVTLTYGTGAAATANIGTYTNSIAPSLATGTYVAGNYTITYTPGNIVVGAAALNITASINNKTYGAALTSGTSATGFTTSGLKNGETITGVTLTYGTGAAATAAVGTYSNAITPSLATGSYVAANYTITYTPGNIVIGQANLTITASLNNKTYGTTLTSGTSVTGFTTSATQNGEAVSGVTLTYGTGAAATAAVGTYSNAITPSLATGGGTFLASNYNITYTPGNIVIGQANLTITASVNNKTYGTTLTSGTSATGFTTSALQNGETVSGVTLTYGTGAAGSASIGTYTNAITPSLATGGGTFLASNYNITYTPGNIVIGAAALNITASVNNKTYGAALTSGTSATGFTTSGLQNGETITGLTLTYGTGAAAAAAVGTYSNAITPTLATGSYVAANYTITYTPGNIVIGQANLTITASTNNKTYGVALTSGTSAVGFTTTALQNGETVSGVTLTYGTGAAATAAVGTYSNAITPSLATGGTFLASNYNITYTPGNIVIGQANLTVTAGVNNKTYGTTLTSGTSATGFTTTALQNGETVSGLTLTYGAGAAGTANIGTYTNSITPSLATGGGTFLASNYNITYSPGNIVIGAAVLNITASTNNKTYGATLTSGTSATGFTTTGLQNGETITGVTLTYGTGAAATANIGTYTNSITPSLATGTYVAGNYTITYTPGNIVVGAAALTITASVNNKTYGATLTSGTSVTGFTTSGLQNGETITGITLTYGTGAAATAAVGTYSNAITPSLATGSYVAANYTITYTPGNIVIGQANLTITASVNNKTYGATLTSGTSATGFTTTALQNGETVSGVTLTYGTGAAATAAVGTYSNAITPSLATGGGTFLASNYNITYTPGNIVIGQANLTITASVNNKTYGTTLTSGTSATGFTTTALQNGETVSGVTLTYGTGAAGTANIGTYSNSITPSLATGSGTFLASNYNITYTPGNIVIGAAALNITASTNNKTYGATLTSGTSATGFTTTGLQNGETVTSVNLNYGLGAAAISIVGTYTNSITPSLATGTYVAANYIITYTPGNIVVGKANLNVTASTKNKTYGTTLTSGISGTGFTTTGLQNGETIIAVTLNYGTGAAATAAVGTYSNSITPSLATGTYIASNYNITYINGDIVIGQANLSITASLNNKTYGTTLTSGTSAIGFTASATQNGETVTGVTLTYGTGALGTAALGTYSNSITPSLVTGGGGFLASNYNITYTPGNIVIGQANLTITASTNNKTYGTTLTSGTSASGFTTTALQNGETVSGVTLTYGAGAAGTANIGTYTNAITPSLATGGGTFLASNYNITYTPGNIVIAPATITVTASTNNKTYGVTLTSGASVTGFTTSGLVNGETITSVTLTYGTGAAANAVIGTYSNAITPSAATGTYVAGNYTITYTKGNIVISQATLTISGAAASNKTYNGNTAAVITGTLSGIVPGDVVTLNGTGTFASPNVGTGIAVTSTSTIGGANAGNYILTQPTGLTANITAVTLTITGLTASNKQYDQTTAATLTGTAALNGVLAGDVGNVTLGGTRASVFVSPNVGTAIVVNVSGYTISGTAAGNYTLTQPSGLTANITALNLTISGITANNKVYDGNTAGTLSGTGALIGVLSGDVVTLTGTPIGTFASSAIGTGIAVTASGYTLGGAQAGNYTVTQPTGLTANIIAPTISYSGSPYTFYTTVAITAVTPTITGVPVSCATSPTLPAGLAISSAGVITGTPTAITGTTFYTVTATYPGGVTATTSIFITVAPAPPIISYSPSTNIYTVGTAISPLTPTNTGGATSSYLIGPSLPSGLSFNNTTGVISGTPSVTSSATVYTITATNTGGVATATVTISCINPTLPVISYSPSTNVYNVGTAITSLTPNTAGGGAVSSFSIGTTLPAGLSFNTTTGVISGTPTVVASTATYVVTATNSAGSATTNITITVNPQLPAISYSPSTNVYTKNTAITPLTPSSTGGPVTSYSISPGLPAGLSFSTSTGVISGTPTVTTSAIVYTITATNTAGSSNTTVTITVNSLAPAFTYSPNTLTYIVGTTITAATPINTGGAPASYALLNSSGTAGTLPAGLSFNTTTGVISGTPTTATTTANYYVRATNSTGTSPALPGFQLIITVNPQAPVLSYTASPYSFPFGPAMTTLTPTNTGGAVVGYNYATTGVSLTGGSLNGPSLMALDAAGNIYVANYGNGTISKYNGSTHAYIGTFGTGISFTSPEGLVFDSSGNCYVEDTGAGAVYKLNSSGAYQSTIISGLGHALGIAINSSNQIFIASYSTTTDVSLVNKYSTAGVLLSTVPVGTVGGSGLTGNMNHADGVAVDGSGNIYVLNRGDNLTGTNQGYVTEYNASGTFITEFSSGYNNPLAISIDGSGDVFVADSHNNQVKVYSAAGGLLTTISGFTDCEGFVADANGNLFVGDYTNNTLKEYAATGGYHISPALPAGLSFSTSTGQISGTATATFGPTTYTVTGYNITGSGTTAVTLTCYNSYDWVGTTSTNWNTPSNWLSNLVPTSASQANIGVNYSFTNFPTVPASSGTVNVGSIQFGNLGGQSPGVSVGTSSTLSVAGAITYQSDASSGSGYTASLTGAGTITANSIALIANTALGSSYTATMASSVTNLNVTTNLALTSSNSAAQIFNATFNLTGGTMLLTGNLQTTNTATSTSSFIVVPSTTATLQLAGTTALSGLSSTGTNVVTFNNTGATVQYSGAAQTVYTSANVTGLTSGVSYQNISFSGTGIKTSSTGNLNISGNFTNTMVNDATNYVNLTSPTLNFNGTTQSLAAGAGNGTTFYNVTFSGAGTKTMASGSFYVASSGVLTMSGNSASTILATGGLLTLNSDASGSATVAAISGPSITGNVSVQRYMQGGNTSTGLIYRGYRLISSPVYAGTVASGLNTFNVYSINYIINKVILTGTTGVAGGFDKTGNPTLYLYREDLVPSSVSFTSGNYWGLSAINNTPNYNYYLNGGTTVYNIPVGAGVMFFFRGDRTAGGTIPSVATQLSTETVPNYVPVASTLSTTGALNQGQIKTYDWYNTTSPYLGYTGVGTSTTTNYAVRGFNLVGNPYASTIDWEQYNTSSTTTGIYANSIGTTIYELNPATNNFDTYQKGGTYTNHGRRTIVSGEGFFVVATNNPNPQLIFNESAKVTFQNTGLDLFMKVKSPLASINPTTATDRHLRVEFAMDTVNKDNIFIGFNDNSSSKYVFDEDAPSKVGNGKLGLTSLSDDKMALAINRLPLPKQKAQIIPLNITASASGIYTISRTELQNIPELYDVWLIDAYKKDSLDIRTNTTYNFNLNKSDTNSFGSHRFSIVIRENQARAVHLLGFTAAKTVSSSSLTWNIENEFDYTHFVVQRSTDGGTTFVGLDSLTSSTLGSYSFVDKNPVLSEDQYRLKIIAIDGTITYSKVVTVMYANTAGRGLGSIDIFPNPTAEALIHLTIQPPTASNQTAGSATALYEIRVVNSSGTILKTETTNQITWQTDISTLKPGIYIIRVINTTDNKLVGAKKFIKL